MGDAVDEDGEQARIGKDDLLLVGGGGVAVEGGLDVRQQHLLDAGQLRHDGLGDPGCLRRFLLRQRQCDLGGQRRLDALQQQRGVVLRRQGHQLRIPEIGGEEQPPQLLDKGDDGAAVGQPQLFPVHGDGRVGHGVRHSPRDISGIRHVFVPPDNIKNGGRCHTSSTVSKEYGMIAASAAVSGRKRMTLSGAADRARTGGGQTTDTAGLLNDHTFLLFARLSSALYFIIRDGRRPVYVQDGQKTERRTG